MTLHIMGFEIGTYDLETEFPGIGYAAYGDVEFQFENGVTLEFFDIPLFDYGKILIQKVEELLLKQNIGSSTSYSVEIPDPDMQGSFLLHGLHNRSKLAVRYNIEPEKELGCVERKQLLDELMKFVSTAVGLFCDITGEDRDAVFGHLTGSISSKFPPNFGVRTE